MDADRSMVIDFGQARTTLGVSENASEAELRSAYLQKVREHPPDRDPEAFEKIRDAYEHLRDPRLRARQVLLGGPAPQQRLTEMLSGMAPSRRFVGPAPWYNVLKEKKS